MAGRDHVDSWAKDIKDTRDAAVASAYERDSVQEILGSASICHHDKHHHSQG